MVKSKSGRKAPAKPRVLGEIGKAKKAARARVKALKAKQRKIAQEIRANERELKIGKYNPNRRR